MASRAFLLSYSELVKRWPVAMNVATGFAIASVGDVAAQRYEHLYCPSVAAFPPSSAAAAAPVSVSVFSVDLQRVAEMGGIRALAIAPFISIWYPFLERSFKSVAMKVLVDQALGSPIVICGVFVLSSLLRGDGIESGLQKITTKGFETWTIGLHYWPLVHAVTFGLIAAQHRPLFAHAASVPWNSVLSYYSNAKCKP